MAENTNQIFPEIQFFGVSCVKFETLCDEYNIEGYPTLRFFKKGEGPPSMGIEAEFDTENAEDDGIAKKIADILNVESKVRTSYIEKRKKR